MDHWDEDIYKRDFHWRGIFPFLKRAGRNVEDASEITPKEVEEYLLDRTAITLDRKGRRRWLQAFRSGIQYLLARGIIERVRFERDNCLVLTPLGRKTKDPDQIPGMAQVYKPKAGKHRKAAKPSVRVGSMRTTFEAAYGPSEEMETLPPSKKYPLSEKSETNRLLRAILIEIQKVSRRDKSDDDAGVLRQFVPKPLPTVDALDIVKMVQGMTERHKHTPESIASHVEVSLREIVRARTRTI